MQIVIDISEESYNHMKNDDVYYPEDGEYLYAVVMSSKPLPKGHGRLIDASKLVPDCQGDSVYYDDDEHSEFTAVGIAQIECAQTIVEADKGDDECR